MGTVCKTANLEERGTRRGNPNLLVGLKLLGVKLLITNPKSGVILVNREILMGLMDLNICICYGNISCYLWASS